MLTKSKFSSDSNPGQVPDSSDPEQKGGSISCGRCILCKSYLVECKTFKSYECSTDHEINCTTNGVIYMIKDLACKRSSVGSTINDMRGRWANYKSHIKSGHKPCELAMHVQQHPSHTSLIMIRKHMMIV